MEPPSSTGISAAWRRLKEDGACIGVLVVAVAVFFASPTIFWILVGVALAGAVLVGLALVLFLGGFWLLEWIPRAYDAIRGAIDARLPRSYKPGRDLVGWVPTRKSPEETWQRWNAENAKNRKQLQAAQAGVEPATSPEVIAYLKAEASGMRLRDLRAKAIKVSTPVVIAGLILAALFGYRAWSENKRDAEMVDIYCSYGARSAAQYDSCLEKVTADDIVSRNTEAAKFARGSKLTCGRDSGPYCHDEPYERLYGP